MMLLIQCIYMCNGVRHLEITQHASSFVAEFFYHLSYTLNSKKRDFRFKIIFATPFPINVEHDKQSCL